MNPSSNPDIESAVWQRVTGILGGDVSGHGVDHVRRVHAMAMRFAREVPGLVDLTVVSLAAQLHDVDDYKLVGKEQSERQANATEIMNSVGIDEVTQSKVRDIIANMGYSKSLKGIRPTTIEGKLVSDADMCDALGAGGVTRCLMYAVSDKGSGVIFRKDVWPLVDITAEQYSGHGTTHDTDSFVNHFFEKLLKLRGMMMTEPGRQEATLRDEQMVGFLRALFREEGVPEWTDFLEQYLAVRA